jgi:tetratricopeptide (TPR) repeat protein
MARTEQRVGVFVSSTFRDMHAERDHLITIVFPELRERLEQLGLELHDVDLRWGVPEHEPDGEVANSWEYCKKALDDTEPLFIGILGHRYGHVPSRGELGEDRERWEGRSITEMEILHAIEDLKRRSFFYLRKTKPRALPHSEADQRFVDRVNQQQLCSLKSYLENTGRPVRPYSCRWDDVAEHFEDLDAFGTAVLEDLWSSILRDRRYLPEDAWQAVPQPELLRTDEAASLHQEVWAKLIKHARPESSDPWEAENAKMDAFAAGRLRWFQGRESELEQLRRFVDGDDEERACVLVGPPGQGKSALFAKFVEDLAGDTHNLLTHFVGATEGSGQVRAVLQRINDWLDREGLPGGPPPQSDLRKLTQALADRLRGFRGSRRLVLVIDALNQLISGHDLSWLPVELGPDVRMIVSCVDETLAVSASPEAQVLSALQRLRPAPAWMTLKPICKGDVRALIERYLAEYSKKLADDQISLICDMPQAGNPLYLRVMLDQLRTLGGDDMFRKVPQLLNEMRERRPDAVSMFEWVLEGLEKGFKQDAVQAWCTYLRLGRNGMSSAELGALLEAQLGPGGALTARRIERGIRRYLQRRGMQVDFFHGQLGLAVDRRYPDRDPRARHGEIAAVLDARWRTHDAAPHALSELPYHLIRAQSWHTLLATLRDRRYVQRKLEEVGPEAIADDFEMAYSTLSRTDPGRAKQLIEVLGHELKAREVNGDASLNIENVNAWLQYAADNSLLEAVLRWGADTGLNKEAANRDFVTLSQAYLIEFLRRKAGNFDEVLRIADPISTNVRSPRALKAASLAKYQAGYVYFLRGQLDHAITPMGESVDLADRSGDEVGAWISRCVLKRFQWLTDSGFADEFKSVLEDARPVFERHADHDPRAKRWRVHNVEGHHLELAFAEADAAAARRSWELIRQDAWETSIGRATSSFWNEARLAMLEGRWEDAVQLFQSIPQNATEPWLDLNRPSECDRTEALAEKYLAYGRALEAMGRKSDAKRAWQRGLECPDDSGNLIWKQRIRVMHRPAQP